MHTRARPLIGHPLGSILYYITAPSRVHPPRPPPPYQHANPYRMPPRVFALPLAAALMTAAALGNPNFGAGFNPPGGFSGAGQAHGGDFNSSCVDDKMDALDYSYSDTCDGGKECTPKFNHMGIPVEPPAFQFFDGSAGGFVDCSGACAGAMTDQQRRAIESECYGDAAGDFEAAAEAQAQSATANATESCFVDKMADMGLSFDGTCDGGHACYESDGGKFFKSESGEACTTPCNGAISMAQQEMIARECENDARASYLAQGGDLDDFVRAQAEAATNAAGNQAADCFDRKFQNRSYSFEGVCGGQACHPDYMPVNQGGSLGWLVSTGEACTSACTGAVTPAQEEAIQAECRAEAEAKFIKSGGSAADFLDAAVKAAENAAVNAAENCFDTKFAEKSYSWTGTCDGTDECTVDYYDGSGEKTDGSGRCTGACTGQVGEEELQELHAECAADARADFIKAGGDANDFLTSAKKGARDALANTAGNCYDRKFAAANYSEDGDCGGVACYVDYYDGTSWMNNGTKCGVPCAGYVTEAMMDAIHMDCEQESRQKFIESGGSAVDFEAAKGEAAMGAIAMEGASCFDTEMRARNLTLDGTCGGDACYLDTFENKAYKIDGFMIECDSACEPPAYYTLVTEADMDKVHKACEKKQRDAVSTLLSRRCVVCSLRSRRFGLSCLVSPLTCCTLITVCQSRRQRRRVCVCPKGRGQGRDGHRVRHVLRHENGRGRPQL